jgi:hypothetical protein
VHSTWTSWLSAWEDEIKVIHIRGKGQDFLKKVVKQKLQMSPIRSAPPDRYFPLLKSYFPIRKRFLSVKSFSKMFFLPAKFKDIRRKIETLER